MPFKFWSRRRKPAENPDPAENLNPLQEDSDPLQQKNQTESDAQSNLEPQPQSNSSNLVTREGSHHKVKSPTTNKDYKVTKRVRQNDNPSTKDPTTKVKFNIEGSHRGWLWGGSAEPSSKPDESDTSEW
jgi:hypothetical protein